jgi:hypothetical protein
MNISIVFLASNLTSICKSHRTPQTTCRVNTRGRKSKFSAVCTPKTHKTRMLLPAGTKGTKRQQDVILAA